MALDGMLAKLNAASVSRDDLLRVTEEANLLDRGGLDVFPGLAAVCRVFGRDFEKVSAVMFPEALAHLLTKEGAPGWTLPALPDGSVLAEEVIFAAAAAEPLVEREGAIRFERGSFLQRALQLAEAEGDA